MTLLTSAVKAANGPSGAPVEYRRIYLPDIVGRGYGAFWRFKGRYRVVKGSRASKKSKTMALNAIYGIMKYPGANLLVVRKTYRTIKDSCYTELRWAMKRLGVERWWSCKESPLEMTYLPTGQKIYFRGLDDPLKTTSITVDTGALCWLWVEEAYEIMKESDFDMLNESIRGEVPPGLYKQTTLTFNPWSDRHWIKARFFDAPNPDVLAMTTNYLCNEWLDDADRKMFEDMRQRNPRRYQVAGLGNWGIVDGLVYENWREERFELEHVKDCKTAFGLDFGYSVDATAFVVAFIDIVNSKLYIYDELYETKLSNRMIFDRITAMGYGKERITADSAEPKSIDELRGLGLRRIEPARKGKDSIVNGIQFIQNFEIIVHPRCVNFLTEISNYTWEKDKFGKAMNRPIDDFNHLMDALRYGCEKHMTKGNKWVY